ncbi:hypothetical protein DK419_16085 [Methylobacterium terrae]|uniref:Bacteriophage tail tape measure N-terminal domain-containing protein n=1 Tax=Methylobacterium terrae TaxID=2202827 RepID=A0A2U8WN07_9HYPH|nr:hypothetical protein [Methylobacterium terrae]AWN47645.1 hypothetical protein DK419_16085 [Methylobacterium terrae]
MAAAPALSFDIEANVSSYNRAMQLVGDTAKQRAAQFALEFSGAGRAAENALGGFARRSSAQITGSLSTVAGRFKADFSAAATSVAQSLKESSVAATRQAVATTAPIVIASAREAVKVGMPIISAGVSGIAKETAPLVGSALLSTATKIAPFVAAYGVATLGLQAFSAAATAAMAALEGANKIGSESARLGVSTNFYQAWTNSAHALNVEAKDLTASLEKAHQAFIVMQGTEKANKEGTGGNQSAFELALRAQVRAGNTAQANVNRFLGSATDEDKLRTALNIMQDMYNAGKQVAALDLASKLFPDSIVDRIRSGALEFRDLLRTANDLSNPSLVLVKAEDVTRAQELERRLKDAQNTLDDVGRQFNQDMVRAGMTMTDAAIRWKEILAEGARIALDAFRFAQRAGQAFQSGGAGLSSGAPTGGKSLGTLLGEAGPKPAAPTAPVTDPAMQNALDAMRGSLNPTNIARAQRQSTAVSNLFFPDKSKPLITGSPSAKSPSSDTSIDAVESFTRSLEKQVAGLKAEAQAFDKSNAEKQKSIQLARAREVADQAGIPLTDAMIERINKAAEAYGNARDKIALMEQAERQAGQASQYMAQTAADGFADILDNARSFSDVLTSIFKQLQRSVIQAIFAGTGPFAGLLGMAAPATASGADSAGGIFGSFFATGVKALMGGLDPVSNFAGQSAGAIGPFLPASQHHTGGIVGQDNVGRRKLPVSLVQSAPRFHSGLTSKEFPAVLEAGERVLTERMARSTTQTIAGLTAATAGAPGGGKPELHIHAGDRTEVQQSQGPQGMRTDVVIDKKVAAVLLGGPSTRSALKQISGSRLTGR